MRIFSKVFKRRPALSFAEMLVTLTIFSIVAMVSVTVMANALKGSRKIQAQAFLYTEAQALMDRMAREVENSSIDYEAYYSLYVLGEGWETPSYGKYAQSFYNPGSDGPQFYDDGPYEDITGYGVHCEDGLRIYPTGEDAITGLSTGTNCFTDNPPSADFDTNTGAHPFTGISAFPGYTDESTESMNAICQADGGTPCDDVTHNILNTLVLINANGDERTIYTRKQMDQTSCSWDFESNDDCALVSLQMRGSDTTSDGLVDTWECQNNFNCADPTAPVMQDFKPLNPSALDIQEFYIYLIPNEDPYRAFAEDGFQVQPNVTLFLTVTLSDSYGRNLLGEVPSITLQRTVSTGVYSEIKSYEAF